MEAFVDNFRKRFDDNFVFSFVASVITSFVVHFMYYANIIYNWDCMLNGPERLGVGIGEGRFFVSVYLSILKALNRGTQINYWNALVGIFFLSLSVALIISILKIKDKILALFIVIIFICYPSVTSLNFHYYCINVYAVSCFFSVLGAKFILDKSKFKKILGSILIGFSIGGYQSYVGISLSILVIYYLIKCFTEEEKINVKQMIVDAVYMLLSFGFYKIFLTIFEAVYKTKANFPLDLKAAFMKFLDCYKITFILPFKNFGGLSSYINSTEMLKLAYLFALLLTFIYMFIIIDSNKKKPRINTIFGILLFILLPPCMFFINIFSDRTPDALMMQSFTFYFIFPIVLHSEISKNSANNLFNFKIVSNIFNIILIIIMLMTSIQYTYMDAYNYHMLAEENREADLKYNELLTRIQSTSGYKADTEIAIIGYMPFKVHTNPYSKDRTWIRGGYLISEPSVEDWIRPYYFRKVLDFNIKQVNDETKNSLTQTNEFRNMGVYPDANSIRFINNVLVVRLPLSQEELQR